MKFNITLTWSKIVAVLILGGAITLDIYLKTDGKLFIYALPFVSALILGRQGKELLTELKK